ncbi:hypothetical protein WT55_24985 [Burkholderia pseudomultivorans]|nr:hypothetical protein WT55_24985 [Burkholderia pseudomultivorans]
MQCHVTATDAERRMCFDDLVDAVRTPVRIGFRAIDQIMQAGNFPAADRVRIRAGNDPAAMVGCVSDDCDAD